MRADIFHNDIFVYSVSGKIAERRIKDKLKVLLPLMWDVAFNNLKRDKSICVRKYKFTWEE
jgi:hypothetical protein